MNKFEEAIINGTRMPLIDLPEVEPPLDYHYKVVRVVNIPVKYIPKRDEFVESSLEKGRLVWKPF